MPKPFKPTRPFSLPADHKLVDVAGKPHVRIRERGKPVLYPLTKDGRKYLRPSKRWYFEYRDAAGSIQRVKGFADLKATEQLAAETVRKASRVRSGFTDPGEEHARRPLAEHLADYGAALEGKGSTDDHIRLTIGRISAILVGCGFVFPSDADAAKATEWLNNLRRDALPHELPLGDFFSPGEVAKLLGISGTSVRAAVKRLKLPATGNGKARMLPRSTVEAVAMNRGKGCGPETANHYTRAVRGFFRWLVKVKRLGSNPLDSLTLLNTSTDIRHARRELTAEELGRLFVATRDSGQSFRGLTGTDRYFLYLVAAGTGFRANALANLTPADFDLNALSPVVTLAARFNKSRKLKIQPLPPDIANALRDHLDGRQPHARIWSGTWASGKKGAEMIRRDLEVAGIAYATEGPDGLEFADFHALRHSYLTLGGRSGIDLRTLQELAGHSKPELTARYSHRRLYDLTGAVGMLPNLVLPTLTPKVAEMPLRMTGTDGPSGAVPGAVIGGISMHRTASDCNTDGNAGKRSASPNPCKTGKPAPKGTGLHRSAQTRATGVEPATSGATERIAVFWGVSHCPKSQDFRRFSVPSVAACSRCWAPNRAPGPFCVSVTYPVRGIPRPARVFGERSFQSGARDPG